MKKKPNGFIPIDIGPTSQDIQKAIWYLNRAVTVLQDPTKVD